MLASMQDLPSCKLGVCAHMVHLCNLKRQQRIKARMPMPEESEQLTPKSRLRGNKGSSVPMDVTSTNLLTLACTAAATRFLVPCKPSTSSSHQAIKDKHCRYLQHCQFFADTLSITTGRNTVQGFKLKTVDTLELSVLFWFLGAT